MSNEELAAAMSRRLIWLEAAYDEAARRADDVAGDDRASPAAKLAMGFKNIHYQLKALHCTASVLGQEAVSMPIARSGER